MGAAGKKRVARRGGRIEMVHSVCTAHREGGNSVSLSKADNTSMHEAGNEDAYKEEVETVVGQLHGRGGRGGGEGKGKGDGRVTRGRIDYQPVHQSELNELRITFRVQEMR